MLDEEVGETKEEKSTETTTITTADNSSVEEDLF